MSGIGAAIVFEELAYIASSKPAGERQRDKHGDQTPQKQEWTAQVAVATEWLTERREWINALSAALVALFTFTLWRATSRLGELTGIQARDMQSLLTAAKAQVQIAAEQHAALQEQASATARVAAAAEISAKAAKDAAEALPTLERAYVVMYPDFEPATTTICGEKKKRINHVTAGYELMNYGRTHAVIKSISFKFTLMDKGMIVPDYAVSLIAWNVMLPGGSKYPSETKIRAIPLPEKFETITSYRHNIFTQDINISQSDEITAGRLFPIVLGKLAYSDIFSRNYEVGICYIYRGEFGLFDQYGGQKYNYWREC